MSKEDNNEIQEEYDLRGKFGVRGKYRKALKGGYKTIIHKSDGSALVREFRPIFLEPELQTKFPDSEAVNRALRELIEIKG